MTTLVAVQAMTGLVGGDGNDWFNYSIQGNDTLDGGAGNDTFWVGLSNGGQPYYFNGQANYTDAAVVTGGSGQDVYQLSGLDQC
jgi:Ca2+-binding RTX toxin-like protein